MNYNDFRYRAVVDTLTIRVRLAQPSHVGHMRKYSGLPWVGAINPGDGGAATVFDLLFNAPKNYADVQFGLNRLVNDLRNHDNNFACDPVVNRIEVSLDAYAKYAGMEPRTYAELVVLMTLSHQHPMSEPRLYKKRYKEKPSFKESFIVDVMDGYIMGMGHKDDHHFQRAYYKTTDNAGKDKLSTEQCRARFENNYSGDALPVTELADLACLKFEMLAKSSFSFRGLSKDTTVSSLHDSLTIPIGRLKRRLSSTSKSRPAYRNSGSHTRAIALLNEHARQALRNLSIRWAAGTTIQP